MIGRAVTNSTCLIALERIGHLELLPQLFATMFAPPAVHEEFGSRVEWLTVTAPKNAALVTALRTQIDDGEAQASPWQWNWAMRSSSLTILRVAELRRSPHPRRFVRGEGSLACKD